MTIKKHIIELSALCIIFISVSMTTGCATQKESIGLGGIFGAGAGAALGGIVDPGKNGKYRTRNILVGAGAGAILGSVTGAAISSNIEREKELSYLKGKESSSRVKKDGEMPSLQEPKVDAIWVESKVIGNRFVEGHYEYIITEPTRWEGK